MYSQACVMRLYTTRLILALQTGSCSLLHESSAEKLMSIASSMSPEWMTLKAGLSITCKYVHFPPDR